MVGGQGWWIDDERGLWLNISPYTVYICGPGARDAG